MLSIAKVAPGRFRYYLEACDPARAMAGGLVEAPGAWLGAAAVSLGLGDFAVDERRLAPLLEGVDPATGEVLDPRHGRVRVAAFDCTFATPKSVSLLHALAAPDVVAEVRAAHESSVAASVGFLEAEGARVRRRGGGDERLLEATGFAAATFLHRVSRAPDPHLHSHVVVANLGCDADGRWSALDARPLYLHAAAAGALYRAQLRGELVRRLDVAWRHRAQGFADLAGVSPSAIATFSRRQQAIEAELEERGYTGRRALRIASAATRAPKDLDTPYESLVESWRGRALEIGVTERRVGAITRPGRRPDEALRPRETLLPELRAPVTRRDLLAFGANALDDGGSVAVIVAGIDAQILEARRSGALVVDPEHRAGRVQTLRGARSRRVPGGLVETVLVPPALLASEARVVEALRRAPGALREVPGIGRMFAVDALEEAVTLRTIVSTIEGAGRSAIVVAPNARSARVVKALSGLEVNLATAHLDRPPRGSTIVLAAAQQAPLGLLERLVEASGRVPVVLLSGTGRAARPALEGVLRDGALRLHGEPGPLGDGTVSSGILDSNGVALVEDPRLLVPQALNCAAQQRNEVVFSTSIGRLASALRGASSLPVAQTRAELAVLLHKSAATVLVVGTGPTPAARDASVKHLAVAPPGAAERAGPRIDRPFGRDPRLFRSAGSGGDVRRIDR